MLGRSLRLALVACALAEGCGASNDVTVAPPPVATVSEGPAAPPPLASGRLPGTAQPLRYALSVVVDPHKDRFSGDVVIDVDLPAATRAVVLHGRELTILRAEVLAGGETVGAHATFRMAAGGRQTPEELVLTLARPIAAGRAQLRIAYSAPLDDKLVGLYRVEDGGEAYAFTQLEPMDARRVFPCFDEPGFKVPFDLKVTTPKGNVVVANAPETDRVESEDRRSLTFTFATTAPLPTYLVAFAVGPLETRAGATTPVPLRVVSTRGKAAQGQLALEAAAAHVAILAEYFDRPFPYAKLDLAAVPDFGAGAMENAGLITFREDLLLLDGERASSASRRNMAVVVAHEIAHHWIGNLVTMSWWDDLWLNEGFAMFMEAKVVDAWRPAMEAGLEALGDKSWVMSLDALETARAVRQPVASTSEAEEAFDGLTYVKGAGVLAMLERWLGRDAFRDGIRSYVHAREHKSATSADLFGALAKTSGKDVWAVASTFLDQPGVPLVRAELVCEQGKPARVGLSQTRYRARKAAPGGDTRWRIPVCLSFDGAAAGAGPCTVLEGEKAEVELGTKRCPRFVHPNAGEDGYYRWHVAPAALAAMASASPPLPLRERIGLLSNAWALVQSGDLPSDALVDLLVATKRERHRLVVEQTIEILEKLSGALVDDASRPAFAALTSELLLPIAKDLGWDARKGDADDARHLRRDVFEALVDDPWLSAEADRRAAKWLVDPRSVDADTAFAALASSTRRSGDKRLGELFDAIGRAKAPEERSAAVRALGTFGDPALLRKALDGILSGRLKLQDGRDLASSAMKRITSRPVLLAWVREHFAELKKKVPGAALARLTSVVGTICDSAVRAEAAAFFGAELRDVEGADRRLAQALETADLCVDLKAREAERFKKRLGDKKRRR